MNGLVLGTMWQPPNGCHKWELFDDYAVKDSTIFPDRVQYKNGEWLHYDSAGQRWRPLNSAFTSRFVREVVVELERRRGIVKPMAKFEPVVAQVALTPEAQAVQELADNGLALVQADADLVAQNRKLLVNVVIWQGAFWLYVLFSLCF